jgi:hypothetical protein
MPAFEHTVDIPTAEGFVVPQNDVFRPPQDRVEPTGASGILRGRCRREYVEIVRGLYASLDKGEDE